MFIKLSLKETYIFLLILTSTLFFKPLSAQNNSSGEQRKALEQRRKDDAALERQADINRKANSNSSTPAGSDEMLKSLQRLFGVKEKSSATEQEKINQFQTYLTNNPRNYTEADRPALEN